MYEALTGLVHWGKFLTDTHQPTISRNAIQPIALSRLSPVLWPSAAFWRGSVMHGFHLNKPLHVRPSFTHGYLLPSQSRSPSGNSTSSMTDSTPLCYFPLACHNISSGLCPMQAILPVAYTPATILRTQRVILAKTQAVHGQGVVFWTFQFITSQYNLCTYHNNNLECYVFLITIIHLPSLPYTEKYYCF